MLHKCLGINIRCITQSVIFHLYFYTALGEKSTDPLETTAFQ